MTDPAPISVSADWPAHRRLVSDLALVGGAVGAAVGFVLLGRGGIAIALVGAGVGVVLGVVAGPRRFRLTLDADGVAIGRLTSTIHIPWPEVVAFGIEDGWQGRRGLTTALAVGRRGDEWPTEVPALAYHAGGFRIGGRTPSEELAPYREGLLGPVQEWAEARAVPIVEGDLADWWDRHRDAPGGGPR